MTSGRNAAKRIEKEKSDRDLVKGCLQGRDEDWNSGRGWPILLR